MEIRISICKTVELKVPNFSSLITVEHYLWMGKKEKVKISERLCYCHTPA